MQHLYIVLLFACNCIYNTSYALITLPCVSKKRPESARELVVALNPSFSNSDIICLTFYTFQTHEKSKL